MKRSGLLVVMNWKPALLSLCGLAVGACTTDNPAFSPPEPVCEEGESYVRQPFELSDPGLLDILFVVDNGPGMTDVQTAFAAAVPSFVTALDAIDGLDWNLAVASTDLRQGGNLQTGIAGLQGCPANRPQVIDSSTPEAGLVAACNVRLGDEGLEVTEGLASARLAIQSNDDIGREGARVVVVFLSIRDDCSAASSFDRSDADNCVTNAGALVPTNDFRNYFANQATSRSGNPVSIVPIVGPAGTAPGGIACSGIADAASGTRYLSMLADPELGRHSFTESGCRTNFGPALDEVLTTAVQVADDALCTGVPMVREPEVVVIRESEADPDASFLSPFGDYLVEGTSESCPNGVVAINTAAHADLDSHRVEVWFCTDEAQ